MGQLKKGLVVAVAALVVAIGAGGAFAQQGPPSGRPAGQQGQQGEGQQGKPHGHRGRAVRAALKVAAGYLGLTKEQLRDELQSGKSLAEVATAHGKTVDGLKQAILADAKSVIDRLVSEGKITAERGQQYLTQITRRLDELVNHSKQPKSS